MQGRELLIGVSGGIAAYKTAMLVSRLIQRGAGVTVVMTSTARKFVGEATFQALTGRRVPEGIFDQNVPLGPHIELAEQADLICVAPASANLLAKTAVGLADDLLSTLLVSFSGPTVLAPAMNGHMWKTASVTRNLKVLREDGFHIVDPEEGWLSCRQQGVGRMAQPEIIEKKIELVLDLC